MWKSCKSLTDLLQCKSLVCVYVSLQGKASVLWKSLSKRIKIERILL